MGCCAISSTDLGARLGEVNRRDLHMLAHVLESLCVFHSDLEPSEARTYASIIDEVDAMMILHPCDLGSMLGEGLQLQINEV